VKWVGQKANPLQTVRKLGKPDDRLNGEQPLGPVTEKIPKPLGET